MITRLAERFFKIRPDEIGFVLTMGAILFMNALTLQITNVVSISGFLNEVGANLFIILWIVEMIVIIGTTGLHSLIVDRFDRLSLLKLISLFFAGLYLILTFMFLIGLPGWLNYSLLSLFVDQQLYFFPIIYWILANDLTHPSRSIRLFPVIASFGIMGDIAGLGISAGAPGVLAGLALPNTTLLILVIIAYLGIFVVSSGLNKIPRREVQRQHETVRETLKEGRGFVQDVPAFRYLMFSLFIIAAVMTIIEYHFLALSESSYQSIDQFQTFYSVVFLIQTIVAIVVQSLLTSRIINWLNLKNTFLLMPATALFVTIVGMIFPGIVSATSGYLMAKLVLNGIDDTSRKSLQAFVPEERRGRVSLFMDSYLYASGVILGSIILGFTLIVSGGIASSTYIIIGILLSALALNWILRMRRSYDASLFNWRLKRRQHMSSILDKLG